MDDAMRKRMRPAHARRIESTPVPPDNEDTGPVANDTQLLSPPAIQKRREWAKVRYSLPPFLERPPFAFGEDQKAFDGAYEHLMETLEPSTWECFLIYDAAVATVEMMRLRRWKMQIIRYMVPQSLDAVLAHLVEPPHRQRLMEGWRGGSSQEIDEIEGLLCQAGHSLGALEALTYFKEIEKFNILEQQIAAKKKTRDNAIFEVQRQRAAASREEQKNGHILRRDLHKGLLEPKRGR